MYMPIILVVDRRKQIRGSKSSSDTQAVQGHLYYRVRPCLKKMGKKSKSNKQKQKLKM